MYMEGLKSKTFRRKPMLTYDGYDYSSSGYLPPGVSSGFFTGIIIFNS